MYDRLVSESLIRADVRTVTKQGIDMEQLKIGARNCVLHNDCNPSEIDPNKILESWRGYYEYKKETKDEAQGYRSAQLGAIFAIKSHWTISNKPATVVMPTGTGKTEVMISVIVSEKRKKTLVIVPSNLLRKQTIERMSILGKLRDIGAIDESFLNPLIGCLYSSPVTIKDLEELIDKSNIIVTTVSLLCSKKFCNEYAHLIASKCDTMIIDEAHHVPSKTWSHIKKLFADVVCLQFTATPFRKDNKK